MFSLLSFGAAYGAPSRAVGLRWDRGVTALVAGLALFLTAWATPTLAAGPVEVTVGTSAGTSGGSTYQAAPTLNVLSPSSGPATGGTDMILEGSGFVIGQTTVSMGGVTLAAQHVWVENQFTLRFITRPHAAGLVDVTVTTPAGTSAAAPGGFTYQAVDESPTVTRVLPAGGRTDGGGTIIVNGTRFVPGATTVTIGGITLQASEVTTYSDQGLTFTAPAHAAGLVDLIVTTAKGSVTLPGGFQYMEAQGPVITRLEPADGAPAGGTVVWIHGVNLSGATDVLFDGRSVDYVDVLTDGFATVITPPGAPGTVDVQVVTPQGTSQAAAAARFTYLGEPVITSITEYDSRTRGFRVNGSNLLGITAAYIGGQPVLDWYPSGADHVDGSYVYIISAGTPKGVMRVDVIARAGAASFSYDFGTAPPDVYAVSPDTGPANGGTVVTLTGNAFIAGGTTVTVGDIVIPAAEVTVQSATSLSFTTPAHAVGTADVFVTTAGGSSPTGSDSFTFEGVPAPTVSTVSPASGPAAGGTPVTVAGTGFVVGNTTVLLDGTPVSDVTVNSETSLTFTTPAHAAGAVTLSVTTPNGAASLEGGFTFQAGAEAPTITRALPVVSSVDGGGTITVNGTGFVPGATTVTIGGITLQASEVTTFSDQGLNFIAPAHAAGTVDLVVTTANGSATLPGGFQYLEAQGPVITRMEPTDGTPAGGDPVYIWGVNLSEATDVLFDGQSVGVVDVLSDGFLAVSTPPGAPGAVDVQVVTPQGTSQATAAARFTYLGEPVITSISEYDSRQSRFRVNGSNLLKILAVSIDGKPVLEWFPRDADRVDGSYIYVNAGQDLRGLMTLQVLTRGGGATFDYNFGTPPPDVYAVSPDTGPANGGTVVTLTGDAFIAGGTTVTVGGVVIPAAEVTVHSETSLSFTTPASAVGTAELFVTTAGGSSPTGSDSFIFEGVAAPTVTTVSPASGPAAGGTTVTVTGAGFVAGNTTVLLDGTSVSDVTVNSETSLTFTTPAHAAGAVTLSVTTPNGAASLEGGFTYVSVLEGPVAPAVSVEIAYGAAGTVTPVTTGGAAESLAIATPPAHGEATVSGLSITYTPTAGYAGADSFTYTATNAGGTSVAATVTITVRPPTITLDETSLPDGQVGTAYSQTRPATGGTGPYVYSLSAGALPAGLSLDAATGEISGTPTAAVADAGFTIRAQDASTGEGPYEGLQAFTLTIAPARPAISAIAPAGGSTGGGTPVTITGSNFVPDDSYAVAFGGTNVAAAYAGPTTLTATAPAGTGTVAVTVSNATTGQAATGSASYTYAPPTVTGLSVTSGAADATHAVTITGSNFTPTATVSVGGTPATGVVYVSAAQLTAILPARAAGAYGVQVTTGAVSSPATIEFAYVATSTPTPTPTATARSVTTPFQTARALTLAGSDPNTPAGALTYAIGTAPTHGTLSGTAPNLSYTPAAGYSGPDSFTFSVNNGSASSSPATVSITVEPGTPTADAQSVSVASQTATAVTLMGSDPHAPARTLTYTVATAPAHGTLSGTAPNLTYTPAAGYSGPDGFTFQVSNGAASSSPATVSIAVAAGEAAPAVTISGSPVAGIRGAAYSASLTASGGTGPHVFSVTAGALPDGLTLASSGSTGTISGTPMASGTFNVTITATDSSTPSASGSANLILTVAAPTLTLSPASGALPAARVGTAYSQSLTASGAGAAAPMTYVITGGTLPEGVTLSSAGVISGTPIASGSFSVDITATDGSSAASGGPYSVSATYSLSVEASTVSLTPTPLPAGAYGAAYAQTLTASGGLGPYSFRVVSGLLPEGIVLSSTGSLSGTTTAHGSHDFTIRATDSTTGAGPSSAEQAYTLVISAPAAPDGADVSAAVPYNAAGTAVTLQPSGIWTSLAVAPGPSNGTVALSGVIATYIPTTGFQGEDRFTYTASGPGGVSAPATVTLTVTAPPPPVVTPPSTTPTPVAPGGGSATVDLTSMTSGEVTGFRITGAAGNGSAIIEAYTGEASVAPTRSKNSLSAAAAGVRYRLVYTPAPGFMGTDAVTLVAEGVGGDSTPGTFTFNVPGKAPDLSATTTSSGSVTVAPIDGLAGGPFQGLRITRQPGFGSATVQGMSIVFTPGPANGGATSLDYVVVLPFGESAAGRLNLVSNLVVVAPARAASTIQGRPVTVRITDGAQGGPFTGAAVTAVTPANSVSTRIVAAGAGAWDLTVTPQGAFSGQSVVIYSLTNALGTATGTLTVTVEARPDPASDPDVRALASSQVQSARRFTDSQIGNVQRRLSRLHDGGNPSDNGLSLNLGMDDLAEAGRDPRTALQRRLGMSERDDPAVRAAEREAELMGLAAMRHPPAGPSAHAPSQVSAAPPASRGAQADAESGRRIGVWTQGSVDWGRQDASGRRDSRFTTQGVTGGLDVALSDDLIVGAAAGYGQDRTRMGDAGSLSRAEAITGSVYGSWRPAPGLYVDGLAGYADLTFDSRRWAAGLNGETSAFARGDRSGDAAFVSAAIGRLSQRSASRSDIYGRLDARRIALDDFTETGAGLAALRWDAVRQDSLSASLGASWRWTVESRRFGRLTPEARLEWSHEFEALDGQRVRYADWTAGSTYLVPLDGWSRDTIRIGLGGEWALSDRLMFSLGYRGNLGDASRSHGAELGVRFGW
ncbi:MAG: IPT/TIG domain-containing protein [Alphaproteobacteria bacterium]|nr:IPT/TIG domain-containing protein [Alphaproteobacteria bacterium]MBU2379394.1 IPT/TIG domain-containing protein [Alphaproteobacteria bacterium]